MWKTEHMPVCACITFSANRRDYYVLGFKSLNSIHELGQVVTHFKAKQWLRYGWALGLNLPG